MELTEEMLNSPYLAFMIVNTFVMYQMQFLDLITTMIYSLFVVIISYVLTKPCNNHNYHEYRPDYILDLRPNWQIIRERYNMN